MLQEVTDNPNVGNLLRGASIILSVEPEVQLLEALRRSTIAERSSAEVFDEAFKLITKIRHELEEELGLNGGELNRDQARKILKHILKDPPWNGISEKQDLP